MTLPTTITKGIVAGAIGAAAGFGMIGAASAAPGPPDTIDDLAPPPELTATVTVDCDDFEDPIVVHVTNHTGETRSVDVHDGVGYGLTISPGATESGPVWFHPIEMDAATVAVAAKDGPVFFEQTIPFDQPCFGPHPDYELIADCDAGTASVLFTNQAITPMWATVVYPPAPPEPLVYVTHISPAEVPLAVSPGDSVHIELYGAGEALFNGVWSFDCGPELDVVVELPGAPAPELTPETAPFDFGRLVRWLVRIPVWFGALR